MRVRDWAGADHYGALGVRTTATRDEITAAYRARARVLHPDTGAVDAVAEAEWVRVAAAYQVLTGPQREEYDRARRRGQVRRPAPTASTASTASAAPTGTAPPRARHLTRRGARGALWGGVALVVAGLVAVAVVITLQARDARLRTGGVPVDATVVRADGIPVLEFTTRGGRVVRADLPDPKSGAHLVGDVVAVRYDADDPTRIVTAQSTVGRDITLWIMAVKLLLVGTALAVIGARRLLRAD